MKFFWKYLFPPIYGCFFYTILRLVSDLTTEDKFWERRWQQNVIEIVATIIMAYPMLRLPAYYVRKNQKNNRPPTMGNFLRELGMILLISMVMATSTSSLVHVLAHDYPIGIDDLTIVNVLASLFMLLTYSILRGNSFIQAFIEQKLIVEKIRNDHLQTELKFLKAQYHPHFLFNALNTVYFQMDEDVAAAKKSVEKFSELLRYQLYDQSQTVPISHEIRYLKNFILLAQTRTSEKLRLQTHFDDGLDGQEIYPLLLLPLVENAFKYVGGDYHIDISVTVDDSNIQMRVDNGIPTDIPDNGETRKGIGLENLKRRLELLYPGKHTFTIGKTPDSFNAALTLHLEPPVAARPKDQH